MNEEYLKKIFEAIGGEEKGYNYNDFTSAMSSNSDYNQKVFNAIGGEGKGYSYYDFSVATGLSDSVKKKDQAVGSDSLEDQQTQVQPTGSPSVEELSQSFTESIDKAKTAEEKEKLALDYREELVKQGVDVNDDATAIERGLVYVRDSKGLFTRNVGEIDLYGLATGVGGKVVKPLVRRVIDTIVGEEDLARVQAQQALPKHLEYDFKDVNGEDQTALVNTLAKQAARMGSQVYQDVLKDIDNDPELLRRYEQAENNRRARMVTVPMTEEEQQAEYERASKYVRTNEEIRQDYISEVFQNSSEDRIRKNLEALLPSNLKEDKQFLEAVADKIYADHGIPTNLDGDNKYNDAPLTEYFARQLDSGTYGLTSSIEYGIGAALNLIEEDFGAELNKQKRAEINENLEEINRLNTQFTAGVTESLGYGDFGNAIQQTAGGLTQTLPIMAATLATAPIGGTGGLIAGAALTGTLGGIQTYVNIRDMQVVDPDNPDQMIDAYTANTALGQAFASGLAEGAFSVVGGKIFKNAAKGASLNKMIGVSRGNMRAFAKGIAKEYGLAMTEEGLTEFATEITNYIVETQLKEGAEFDLNEAMLRGVDAFIIGSLAGSGFKSLGDVIGGNLNYNSYAAAALLDPATIGVYEEIDSRIGLVKEKLKTESDPKKKAKLEAQVAALRKTKMGVRQARSSFFDSVYARNPEAMEQIHKMDQDFREALARAREAKSDGDTDLEKSYRDQAKKIAESRMQLIDGISTDLESNPLTNEEKTTIFSKKTDDAIKEIDSEISDIKESLAEERTAYDQSEGTLFGDYAANKIDNLESMLEDAVARKQTIEEAKLEFTKSRSRLDALGNKENLSAKEKAEQANLIDKITSIQENLGKLQGVDFNKDMSSIKADDFDYEPASQKELDELLSLSTSTNIDKTLKAIEEGAQNVEPEVKPKKAIAEIPQAEVEVVDDTVDAVDDTEVIDAPAVLEVDPAERIAPVEPKERELINEDDSNAVRAYVSESVENGDSKQYTTNNDGTIGIEPEGNLSGRTLAALNRAVTGLSKTLGRPITVIVAKNSEMGASLQGTEAYFDSKTDTIFIDPFKFEGEGETNALGRTIFEEIAHGTFNDAVVSLDVNSRFVLVSDLVEAISNTDQDKSELIQYLEDQIRLYASESNPLISPEKKGLEFIKDNLDSNLFAKEAVAKLLSKADNANLSDSQAAKVGKSIRKVLTKWFKTIGAKFVKSQDPYRNIQNKEQLDRFLKGMKRVVSGEGIDVDKTSSPDEDVSFSKSQRDKISPFDLPEGKFTVTYQKQRIKGGKDIGSYPVSMEFNGKQHFINWWKKTTFPKQMYGKRNVKGSDVGVANTVRASFFDHRIKINGKELLIDTDVLEQKFPDRTKEKKQFFVNFYKRRGPVSIGYNNMSADLQQAFKDGLISTNVYNDAMEKLQSITSWGRNIEKRSEDNPGYIDSFGERSAWMKEEYSAISGRLEQDRIKLNKSLAKIAKDKGLTFNYEEGGKFYSDKSRGADEISFAYKDRAILTKTAKDSKGKEITDRMDTQSGITYECEGSLGRASEREICLQKAREMFPDATPEEIVAYSLVLEADALLDAFNDPNNDLVTANPFEFQKRSLEATDLLMNHIFKSEGIPVSRDLLPLYRMIIAITSNGTDRMSNFKAANAIFRSVIKNPQDKIQIPESTIKALEKGDGVFKLLNQQRSKKTKRKDSTVGNHLRQLNKDIDATIKSDKRGRFNGGVFSAKMQASAKGKKKGKKGWTYAMETYGGKGVGKIGSHFGVMAGGDSYVQDLNMLNFFRKFTGDLLDYSLGGPFGKQAVKVTIGILKRLKKANLLPGVNIDELNSLEVLNLGKKLKEDKQTPDNERKNLRSAISRLVINEKNRSFENGHKLASEVKNIINRMGEGHEMIKNMLDKMTPEEKQVLYKTDLDGNKVFDFPLHMVQSIAYAGEQAYRRKSQFNNIKGYTDDLVVANAIIEEDLSIARGETDSEAISKSKKLGEKLKLDMENDEMGAAIYAYDVSTVTPLEVTNTDLLDTDPVRLNVNEARDVRLVENVTFNPNKDQLEKARRFEEVSKDEIVSIDGKEGDVTDVPPSAVEVIMNPLLSDYPVTRNFEAIKSADRVIIVDGKMYVDGNISTDKGAILRNDPTGKRNYPAITESVKEKIQSYAVNILGMDPKDVDVDFIYEMTDLDVMMNMNKKGSFASNVKENDDSISRSKRLRQTAEKGAKRVSGARTKILNNPENYITPQNLSRIKSRLNQMSDAELMGEIESAKLARLMNSQDPIAPLAAGELINREIARAEITGNYDGVADLYEDAAKMGTTAGRILRQLRELSSTTPKGMAASIFIAAEKRGNFLTKEQEAKVEAAAGKMLNATKRYNDLKARARVGEDVEADLKDAYNELLVSKKEMGDLTNRYVGQGFGDIFTQLVQGNLLVPESHETNLTGNMSRMFDKLFVDAIALPVQNVLNRLSKGYKGSPRRYSLAAQLEGFKALRSGFVEAYRTAKSGIDPDTTSEWRMYSGLKPFTSLMDAVSGQDLPLNDKGQVNVKNRARLAIQGVLGISPEMSFRLLGFFDTPFRRYVEAVELHHMGKERGLSGEALKRFIKHPDIKSLEQAESEGRKLTFQEDTMTSRLAMKTVNAAENIIGGALEMAFGDRVIDPKQAARVFVRTLTPYVKTPANILSETLTYISPYYAGLRILKDLRQGDTKAASQNFGKAIIGSIAAEAAIILVREGLVTASASYDDKEDEALSNLMYTEFQPESINVTGLKRWLLGGSPEHRGTDWKIQYKKLGIMGQVMGTVVNSVDKEELMARDYSGGKFLHHAIRDSFGLNPLSGVAQSLDQSFLQGLDGFLNVLTSLGDSDRRAETSVSDFTDSIMRSASASVLPNTLSAINRATREFMPDRKLDRDMPVEERIVTNFKYIIKDRLFSNSDIPIKVNWKGEDIPQTPDERNGFFYHLFDITNARQGTSDPVSNEIWRLMESTGKTSLIPSTPKYASYFGGKINVPNLNQNKHKRALRALGKDYSFLDDQEFLDSSLYFDVETLGRVMRVSGRDRLQAAEKLIASSSYQKLDDEAKLERLDKLNDDYNSAIEFDNGRFRPHSVEILDILQEIYDNEWGAEQE